MEKEVYDENRVLLAVSNASDMYGHCTGLPLVD